MARHVCSKFSLRFQAFDGLAIGGTKNTLVLFSVFLASFRSFVFVSLFYDISAHFPYDAGSRLPNTSLIVNDKVLIGLNNLIYFPLPLVHPLILEDERHLLSMVELILRHFQS